MDGMIDKVNYFFDDLEERQEIWELLKQRDDILVSTLYTIIWRSMDQGRLKGKDFCALLPYLESDGRRPWLLAMVIMMLL